MSDQSERTECLVEEALAGDEVAWIALSMRFEAFFLPLWAKSLNDDSAADILQDAARRASAAIRRGRGPQREKWRWWYRTIVRNVAADRMKVRSAVRPLPESPSGQWLVADLQGSDGSGASAAEKQAWLVAAVSHLTAEQQEMIKLHVHRGFDLKRVAEQLGVEHAAARQRWSRLVKQLVQQWRDGGASSDGGE
jgi:RNA polymerase sigma factor (sigma-70 family)